MNSIKFSIMLSAKHQTNREAIVIQVNKVISPASTKLIIATTFGYIVVSYFS
jgi:hypothetical protein